MPEYRPEYGLAKDLYEGTFGTGAYERRWLSLPWYSRLWYTLRGYSPGGRKGAPALDIKGRQALR